MQFLDEPHPFGGVFADNKLAFLVRPFGGVTFPVRCFHNSSIKGAPCLGALGSVGYPMVVSDAITLHGAFDNITTSSSIQMYAFPTINTKLSASKMTIFLQSDYVVNTWVIMP